MIISQAITFLNSSTIFEKKREEKSFLFLLPLHGQHSGGQITGGPEGVWTDLQEIFK